MIMNTMENDWDIIQSVLSGNAQDYAELVRKHMDRIYSFCLSLLNNPTEAEDAAQDVFIKAYNNLSKFKGDSQFYTWICRIAHNQCMDVLRKKSRQKTDSWDAMIEISGEKIVKQIVDADAAEDSAEKSRLAQQLLGHLPEEYRIVLTLRETQDLSYEDIAKVMGCSLDSVKARLRRARAMLKDLFKKRIKEEVKPEL